MPTILLVDNEPDIRSTVRMALEWRGCRVLLSGDGRTALEKAGRNLPDLVVTDCSLPEMDGVELCRHLKSYSGPYGNTGNYGLGGGAASSDAGPLERVQTPGP
jgi:CheY-like chemotaxis protein